ncbi:MAG: energy-coupling factor transporter ATPase [Lachnospiraceae bacterium]|nr:energy-coupling factor transporter ATPase [Lachnospiraceae bacterium]
MNIIKVKDLVFLYRKKDENGNITQEIRAVDGVDMEVEKGSFIAILGHNGSGKSSLAKHINGILFPTEGHVKVNEMDTRDESKIWHIRQIAGMVFQNPDNQIIGSIVEEDVAFGPENLGVPTDEIWERVDRCLKAVNMEAFRESSPNKLSGGQKQRVAIAGIMAMEPECIVLDEPTAMLDPRGRQDVIDTIHELNEKKGITILLITHNMDEVIGADKVFVMDQGKVVMSGKPREIFTRVEEIKSYGLEIPHATELAYRLRQKGVNLPKDILTREELVEAICQLN